MPDFVGRRLSVLKKCTWLIPALLILASAEAALAAAGGGGGEHHGLDWPNFAWRVANFAIFFAILYKVAGKKIADFFVGRRRQIAEDLDELTAKRREAEAKLAEVEKSIANMEEEREAILEDFKKQGEDLKASIIEKAKEDAVKLKEQAEKTAASELNAAKEELKAMMADMVVEASKKKLEEKLDKDAHEKLIDESIAKVVLN
jgi:F-type H+-transporting ATPase subunit b